MIRRVDLGPIARQFRTYFGVGLLAAGTHYGLLVGMVEGFRLDPLPSTLVGYVAGGFVSYSLNRRLTFASARPHSEATWRFIVVVLVGFGLTWMMVGVLLRVFALPYLLAQVITTGTVLFWNFSANRLWTFRGPPIPPVP